MAGICTSFTRRTWAGLAAAFALLATSSMALLGAASAQSGAPPRLALVIGIGDYNGDGDVADTDRDKALASGFVTDLRNAPNDAADVAAQLRGLGYQVTPLTNPTRAQLLQTALDFGQRVRAAGPDAQVVVFFAGHGVQVDGANFLIPSRAQLPGFDFAAMPSRDAQELLSEYATPLNTVLGRLQPPSDRGFNLVILDACRDNPWDQRIRGLSRGSGGARGLADVRLGLRRTALAFSTQPGDTADDGAGRNSPYTAALTRVMQQQAGQPLTQMLEAAAAEVEQQTRRQIPHLSTLGSLAGACLGACLADKRETEIERLRSENKRLADLAARPEPSLPAPVAEPQRVEEKPAPQRVASLPDARSLGASSRAPVLASGQRAQAFNAFRDCADCVEMVALPGGTFKLGSPKDEPGRDSDEDQVSVRLSAFAVSRFPVTRGEYAAFVAATGRATQGNCYTDRATKGSWAQDPQGTWRDPAFPQTDRHPVVCVDHADAEAYARWMKQRTGQDYRLLSEAQYEFANRGGRSSAYNWGPDANAGCTFANGADATAKRAFPSWTTMTCDDGFERTSPVGSFTANPYGLFDTTGNVWSWTADCYVATYASNPKNGQSNTTGDCSSRVLRGGSWFINPQLLRSANRTRGTPTLRNNNIGFRLARTL